MLERPSAEVERPPPAMTAPSATPPEQEEAAAAPGVPSAIHEEAPPASQEEPSTAPTPAPWAEPGSQLKAAPLTAEVMAKGRGCPQCGTANPDGADFCWQCHHAFPRPGALPGMAQVRGGPSAYSQPIGSPLRPLIEDTASKRSFDRGKWTKVALVAVVALVAAGAGRAVMQNMNRTHLQVPASISGMQRIDDAKLAQAVQSLEQIVSDNGSTGKAGFYGYNGVPAFFFAAFEYEASADQSPDDIFSEFSGGFATGGTQSVIDLRSKTTDTVGEATYICAKLKGKPAGSICMWADSDIVGFVGAFGQNTKTAESLTAAVRTSVEV